ncbi:MAG TPA: DUF1835 domain-containing protein [Gemmatimonadales bacterium]|nr:DUF1835 domain-containing protein [Gemmatimonadales bacterium]
MQFLHIRCGDDILGRLEEAGIPGDKIRWSDILCEGPLHAYDDEQRQKERAAYLAARYLVPMTETYREILGADWRVTQCARYDETVLWFEADLFDQAILVYLLQRLAPLARDTRLSLICIGDFPGITRFIGLGQLTPAELATLLPQRHAVTRRQFSLARQTWGALTYHRPNELNRIARMRTQALPFLPAAIRRYLAEYPSTTNGLSQTEQWALEAIAAGAKTPLEAFPLVQNRELRPFLGDSMFYAVLRTLASGDHPALAGAHRNLLRLPDAELRQCPVWLTTLGKRVLANKTDWFELSETARWMGGVLVRGPKPRWRWDPKQQRVVEQRRRRRS